MRPLVAAVAILHGCGSAASGDRVDAGRSLDSGVVACADAAGCASQAFATVCAESRCVECETNRDCDSNPSALGVDCDLTRGHCTCGEHDDCAGNRNGPSCNELTRSCGCASDIDCADGRTCVVEPYLGGGVRTCQPL